MPVSGRKPESFLPGCCFDLHRSTCNVSEQQVTAFGGVQMRYLIGKSGSPYKTRAQFADGQVRNQGDVA